MVDIVPADPKVNAPSGHDNRVGGQDSKGSSTKGPVTSAEGIASSAEAGGSGVKTFIIVLIVAAVFPSTPGTFASRCSR